MHLSVVLPTPNVARGIVQTLAPLRALRTARPTVCLPRTQHIPGSDPYMLRIILANPPLPRDFIIFRACSNGLSRQL